MIVNNVIVYSYSLVTAGSSNIAGAFEDQWTIHYVYNR